MKKEELYRYVGSMEQLAFIRPSVCDDGRSRGMKVYEVKNGALSYQVMADKCLDISALSYKGISMHFLSKPGLQGRNHYDTNGGEAQRSIMGGLFFTAGLENICAPCELEGKQYPMHGRMRTTPAQNLCAESAFTEEGYRLSVSGEMREAELFGENMVLRRRIESVYGKRSITVTDEIENQAFREEPMMLLYHINLGYPFLDENFQLFLPTRSVTARDGQAEGHEKEYDRMESPKANEPEYVFIHDMKCDEAGNAAALAINRKEQIGLKLQYPVKNLPYFMEWKSIASGDYVLGLEPSNSSVYGRPYHEKEGSLFKLKPFEKVVNRLVFTVLDGEKEIGEAIEEFQETFNKIN